MSTDIPSLDVAAHKALLDSAVARAKAEERMRVQDEVMQYLRDVHGHEDHITRSTVAYAFARASNPA